MMRASNTIHMLRPLLALLFTFSFLASDAQKLKERMAERYAQVLDLPNAAVVYEDISSKGKATNETYRKMAKVYLQMGNKHKAEEAYAKLMEDGNAEPSDVYTYASLLQTNGKYTEALKYYDDYTELVPDDPRAMAYKNNPGLFERLKKDSTRFDIRTLPINSAQADLGLSVMDELLLFSSARGEGVGGKRKYAWDHQPYLNLYSALLEGENARDVIVMHKDINSRYHDGTATYDSVAQRLFFTRNNYHYGSVMKASDGELKLGIFYSDIIEGEFGNKEWGPLVPFDHNNLEYNVGHPAVSPDGQTMILVSDMPGGYGGTDLYKCSNISGSWGVPVNMGPEINTRGDEMFPFIGNDSIFYFASKGHAGLGGFDIFFSTMTPDGVGNVFNMGYPMNTRHDDHSMIKLANDTIGFFVSDRPGGMGDDDVYGFTEKRPIRITLSGKVVDKQTREGIDGATIVLNDKYGQPLKDIIVTPGPDGSFTIDAPYSPKYTMIGSKKGYLPDEHRINTAVDDLSGIELELQKYDYGAEGLVMKGEDDSPLSGATVYLFGGDGNLIDSLVTDETGKYSFPLDAESDYKLRVEKEGFFTQSARISTKGKPSAVIHTDFRLFELELNKVVRLDNIFYDYNKWNIRPDAAIELDKLVQTLLDNPTVVIELSSHTDCRGSDSYNQKLSQKRAKSAVDYIISKGIPSDRIKSKGYGESKPANDCECTKCTDEEHQYNRRSEFMVLDL